MQFLGEKLSQNDIVEMIREADKDGDGLINFSEFRTMMILKKGKQQCQLEDVSENKMAKPEENSTKIQKNQESQSRICNNKCNEIPPIKQVCHCTCSCSACSNCSFKIKNNSSKAINFTNSQQIPTPPKITPNTSTTSTNSSSSGYCSGSVQNEQQKSSPDNYNRINSEPNPAKIKFAKLTPENLGISTRKGSDPQNINDGSNLSVPRSPMPLVKTLSDQSGKSTGNNDKSPGMLRNFLS